MEPLPATAEALELLAASGDEDLGTRLVWLAAAVQEVVAHVNAMAIWFAEEDLTLVLVTPLNEPSHRRAEQVIRSSLALPIAAATRVISVVTIYSERTDVFAGRIPAVERAVGAVWNASVLNDDLAFGASDRAELAPTQLRARLTLDIAVGVLMGRRGFTLDEAEDWIAETSHASGLTPAEVAADLASTHPGLARLPGPYSGVHPSGP